MRPSRPPSGSLAECRHFRSAISNSIQDRTPCASRLSMIKTDLQSVRFSYRGRKIERAADSERHAATAPSRSRLAARRSPNERGYVLISAIALAILYFGLMELMLIDSSRAQREAQRFRARVVASALAESAAELAAAQMVTRPGGATSAEDEQGKMLGSLEISGNTFELVGQGNVAGVVPMSATVRVQGRIVNGTHIAVDYTFHSQ